MSGLPDIRHFKNSPVPGFRRGLRSSPGKRPRGWRAEKAQPVVSCVHGVPCTAPFGAPPGEVNVLRAHLRRSHLGAGPRFAHGALRPAVTAKGRASKGPWPSRPPGRPHASAVSQPLAGSRSGAGRSPDAARVRGARSPRPRAPRQPMPVARSRPWKADAASPAPKSFPLLHRANVSRRRPSTSKARLMWGINVADIRLLS